MLGLWKLQRGIVVRKCKCLRAHRGPESRVRVQELLGDPNPLSPAQADAFALFQNSMSEYRRRVRAQAVQFPPPV